MPLPWRWSGGENLPIGNSKIFDLKDGPMSNLLPVVFMAIFINSVVFAQAVIPPMNPKPVAAVKREMMVENRLLHLPVKTGAKALRMLVKADGETVRDFLVEITDAKPDFYTACDVGLWVGKQVSSVSEI
jgi:hypothetical protein